MGFEAALQGMREAGAVAAAIVSRDGNVLAANLPAGVSKETFSIMCATIHGAGMTVSNELRRGPPQRIVLDSAEGRVVIAEAGRRVLLVVVLAPGTDLDETSRRLQPFIDLVEREAE